MINIVNPYFKEDFYKGQDTVNYGSLIPLDVDPNLLLKQFTRNTRRKIEKHLVSGVRLNFEELKSHHLSALRALWFNPADKTFPDVLDSTLGGFVVYDKNEMLGGVIWKANGNGGLFLQQLISNEKGKEVDVPTLLIWNTVTNFYYNAQGMYSHLDIGVSYNPNRQRFMQGFAIKKYPVILKKPFYPPVIRFSPFRSFDDLEHPVYKLKDDMTFVPRASYGLFALLKHLGLGSEDTVSIMKTFHTSPFISGCVTQQIEKVCKWELSDDAGAPQKTILVIHEFGVPFPKEIIENLIHRGHTVIEDCAWRTERVSPESQYAIYSAQKMFNINYGGIIEGVHIEDDELWQIGCLDTIKREKFSKEVSLDCDPAKRVYNWELYNKFAKEFGIVPAWNKMFEAHITTGSWIPTVYMQEIRTLEMARDLRERLEKFGIQAGIYWGTQMPIIYLPIHQNMSAKEVEYMFAVVAGYYNSCRDYNGK